MAFGSTLGDQAAFLRTALLTPHGDRPRKGGLNKACLTSTWLASHGQWVSLPSGKKNERKKNTANLKVACSLLEFCSEHQLVIINTLFKQKDRFKVIWRQLRSKYWHLLDYILTPQHDTRDVQHTRVMSIADCYIDHRLVCCKVAFAAKRKGPQMKKLQVHKLCDPRVKNNLQVMLEERHHCVTAAEPEEQWKQMKTILQ